MAIELAGYRGWRGELRPPWMACWPIVRTGLWLVLRRKLFWPLFALGLLNFLFAFAVIYFVAQLKAERTPFLDFIYRLAPVAKGDAEGYHVFFVVQSVITMLLLAFSGSVLVGSDSQQGGVTFYLSRRIGKRHYLAGKVIAVGTVVSLITTVPALGLYAANGLYSTSFDYLIDEWRLLLGIIGYGTIQAAALSLLLVAVALWIPRTVPLVMTWVGIFVLLPILGETLRQIRDNRLWRLLAFRRDLDVLGRKCFGMLDVSRDEAQLAFWAGWIVLGVCALCLIAMVRRVRAVEVVR